MRKSFGSHRQLAHVWAQQKQSDGKLNTPEATTKRGVDAVKRAVKAKASRTIVVERERARKDAEEQALAIDAFRTGKPFTNNIKREYELLRLRQTFEGSKPIVQTSRGAEVPLSAAKQLFDAIVAGIDVKGKSIGEFTVDEVKPLDKNDAVIHIGCHRILLSEAKRLFENMPRGLYALTMPGTKEN